MLGDYESLADRSLNRSVNIVGPVFHRANHKNSNTQNAVQTQTDLSDSPGLHDQKQSGQVLRTVRQHASFSFALLLFLDWYHVLSKIVY